MAAPTIDQWNPENGITLNEEDQEKEERRKDEEALANQVRLIVVDYNQLLLFFQVLAVKIQPQTTTASSQESSTPASSQGTSATPSAPVAAPEAGAGDENVSEADISLMRKLLRTKLIDSKNNIEIVRSNPQSPLYSVKSFEELRLPQELLKGLYAMGFQAPSKIQETALPILLANP